MGDQVNDFWGTVGSAISAVRDYKIARTQSSPSGRGPSTPNPGPGSQSPYPQNDTKPAPGGVGFSFSLANASGLFIVAGIVLLLFVFLRGK